MLAGGHIGEKESFGLVVDRVVTFHDGKTREGLIKRGICSVERGILCHAEVLTAGKNDVA